MTLKKKKKANRNPPQQTQRKSVEKQLSTAWTKEKTQATIIPATLNNVCHLVRGGGSKSGFLSWYLGIHMDFA